MVAGVIHISDQFELNQESAAEQDEKSTTTDWKREKTRQPEVGKCQEDSSSSGYFLLCFLILAYFFLQNHDSLTVNLSR